MRNKTEILPLLVVAAALTDAAGRMLLQQRKKNSDHGGLWEFPGGKIEPGEARRSALTRELAEELGIAVNPSVLAPLGFATSDAPPARPIVLLLYGCTEWLGEPLCIDAEAIGWFAPAEIAHLAMPPLDIDVARDALGIRREPR